MKQILIFILAVSAAAACSHQRGLLAASPEISASVFSSSPHCGPEGQPDLKWVDDKSEMADICRTQSGRTLKKDPCEAAGGVDFSSEAVLVINMGRKPTGGYSLTLAGEKIRISDGTAVVRVRRTVPDPNAVLPQVISHPCMMLRITRGDYSRVRVVDQDNQAMGEITLP